MTDSAIDLDRFRFTKNKAAGGETKARFKRSPPKELWDKVELTRLKDRQWDDFYPARTRLFHYLRLKSRRGLQLVPLTNTMAAEIGLSREQKRVCLLDLERRGLVVVERRGQKVPQVKVKAQ